MDTLVRIGAGFYSFENYMEQLTQERRRQLLLKNSEYIKELEKVNAKYVPLVKAVTDADKIKARQDQREEKLRQDRREFTKEKNKFEVDKKKLKASQEFFEEEVEKAAKSKFMKLSLDKFETPEAHDKALLAAMFKESINFDAEDETHVKGLSAILSSDRVVKPNTVNYYDYLKSPQWQTVRGAALKRANYQCEKCKSAKNLEVHHITYKRLGYELPEDLIVLCKDCHENVHSKDLKQDDDFFANSPQGFPEGF